VTQHSCTCPSLVCSSESCSTRWMCWLPRAVTGRLQRFCHPQFVISPLLLSGCRPRGRERRVDRGLVHKDLKAAKILLSTGAGETWLSGFCLASHFARERQIPDPAARTQECCWVYNASKQMWPLKSAAGLASTRLSNLRPI
jgi:hypothetical protein